MKHLKSNLDIAKLFVLILVSILFGQCYSQSSTLYNYQIPDLLNDGLITNYHYEASVDTGLISSAIKAIRQDKFGQIHSLLIYKQGELILEEYFPGYTYRWDAPGHRDQWVEWKHNMLHSIMSDTKSITSACVGLALKHGFIEDVHQSIFDYLPEHQQYKNNGREKITIEHLLTMTSGLDWTEWKAPYSDPKNPIIGIWFSDQDPISFILDQELKYDPGTHYSYFGGHQILLGEIIRQAAGMSIDTFSQKYLFDPLGIDTVNWSVRFDNGVIEAAGGLKMRPRDMLKVGILFLDGEWKNKKIVTADWISKSATAYPVNTAIKVPGTDHGRCGYTYSWWNKEVNIDNQKLGMFWAGGWGGQKILVIPKLQTVIVLTGGNYTSKTKQFKLLTKYLLPAIMSPAE